MAYDEGLAQRLREHPALSAAGPVEKKMFGGLAFLVNGNMCVGVVGDELIARVGTDAAEAAVGAVGAVGRPGARPMDFTGTPMRGWLTIGAEGIEDDDSLAGWVDDCLAFVQTLPAK